MLYIRSLELITEGLYSLTNFFLFPALYRFWSCSFKGNCMLISLGHNCMQNTWKKIISILSVIQHSDASLVLLDWVF